MKIPTIMLLAGTAGSLVAQVTPASPDLLSGASTWTPLTAVIAILVYLVTKAIPEKDKLHRDALKEVCDTHSSVADKICLSLDSLATSSSRTCGEQREYDSEQRELERKQHAEIVDKIAGRCDQKIEKCREANHMLANALQVHKIQPSIKREE